MVYRVLEISTLHRYLYLYVDSFELIMTMIVVCGM
jgi:hypothetical protein